MYHFIHEELIQNSGFPSVVQANNNDFMLLVGKKAPQFAEEQTHFQGANNVSRSRTAVYRFINNTWDAIVTLKTLKKSFFKNFDTELTISK